MDEQREEHPEQPDPERIRKWLVEKVSLVSGLPPQRIDVTIPFDTYGVHSTEAVSVSGELEELLGKTLSPTILYQYSTINELTEFLTTQQVIRAPEPAPENREHGPDAVCVVGMACRFPGADNTDEFWHGLTAGRHFATDVPTDRWDSAAHFAPDLNTPGKAYTNRGAFVADIAGFDASFFDVSPQEALRMDPRQRMLLEVTSAALEDAAVAADRLRGTRTGVFVGVMADNQYATVQAEADPEASLDDPYFGIGVAPSVLAGRLSYLLDLAGPALVTDTACSSALVAVHLARSSLHRHESDLAIVGGVSAVLHPDVMRQACKMHMLAPDGRCKTFDAAADGFLIGEGCGVVILERMSDALANGHRVLAVLSGSAVNQDGRSNGLTAPNGLAQRAVVRAAIDDAGISRHAVAFVEAHGSGTRLGDATEMESLTEVFGPGRDPGRPLVVGAVKTNVGHLLGAAGMAGLIKTIRAVRDGAIPANLHLSTPNPAIDWDRHPVVLPAELTRWPATDARRAAGVSSFGWSGTNAHVIVEEATPPPRAGADADPRTHQLLLLSGRTERGLVAAARNLADRLRDQPEVELADVALTTQLGRSAHEYRVAVPCRDVAGARDRLAGDVLPMARYVPRGSQARVGLLLPGAGGQYVGMGRGLYEAEEVFRAALDECAELLAGPLGLDLRRILYPDHAELAGATAAMRRPDVADSAIFAVSHAYLRLWQHLGVRPVAALGDGAGELVAACLSGVFSLRSAAALVVGLARAKRRDEAIQLVAAASPGPPSRPLLSSRTGNWITDAEVVSPVYWATTGSRRLRPETGHGYLRANGATLVLEIGPGQPPEDHAGTVSTPPDSARVASVRPAADPRTDREYLLGAAGRLWTYGATLAWRHLGSPWARTISLPTYPFERTRFWPVPAGRVATDSDGRSTVGAAATGSEAVEIGLPEEKLTDPGEWYHVPAWHQHVAAPPPAGGVREDDSWLVFADRSGVGDHLARSLRREGRRVVTVSTARRYERVDKTSFTIDPTATEQYVTLLRELVAEQTEPTRVVHAWGMAAPDRDAAARPAPCHAGSPGSPSGSGHP